MKATRFLFILILAVLPFQIKAIEKDVLSQKDHNFSTFLTHFTNSATFQYSRIKFPLKSPITLMADDGNSEKKISFTKDKWPLLSAEALNVKTSPDKDGNTYVAKYVVNNSTHKEFQSGYEDSEIELKVIFDLIDGKWYVTDCYTAWYNFELSIEEFKSAIIQVQKENAVFTKIHP